MHAFEPASGRAGGTTLLLLHGTGGDEHDLLPLGRALAPGAALLSPRGPVLENGMPRWFRRRGEGVFDLEDLGRRTDELAAFIEEATARYALDAGRVVAVGFSNGANIAASVLLRRPGVLSAAALLSPMLPYEPPAPSALAGTSVFISAGRADPFAPGAQVERLAALLRGAGADVRVHWRPGGHAIDPADVEAVKGWIGGLVSLPGPA